MKKGRHRRHQQARALKHGQHGDIDAVLAPADTAADTNRSCDECQRWPHADWCLANDDD